MTGILGGGDAQREASITEDEVLKAEDARYAALIGNDFTAMECLCADDLLYVHSSGAVDGKDGHIVPAPLERFALSRDAPERCQGAHLRVRRYHYRCVQLSCDSEGEGERRQPVVPQRLGQDRFGPAIRVLAVDPDGRGTSQIDPQAAARAALVATLHEGLGAQKRQASHPPTAQNPPKVVYGPPEGDGRYLRAPSGGRVALLASGRGLLLRDDNQPRLSQQSRAAHYPSNCNGGVGSRFGRCVF
jgi:hypothetical protein